MKLLFTESENNNMETQYVYLLREREFVKTGESIYKVGKTKQKDMKRFDQYPKGSVLELYMRCEDCDKLEKDILKVFRQKYQDCKENIGREYFIGNGRDMVNTIYETMRADTRDRTVEIIKELEDPDGVCPFSVFYDYYIKQTGDIITKTVCSIRLTKAGYKPEEKLIRINGKLSKCIRGLRNPTPLPIEDVPEQVPLPDMFTVVCKNLEEEGGLCPLSILYDHYTALCTTQPLSKIACSKRLNEAGYESVQMKFNGKVCKVIKGLKNPCN